MNTGRAESFCVMSDLRTALSDAHLYGILDMGYVKADRAESVTRDLLKGGVDLLG